MACGFRQAGRSADQTGALDALAGSSMGKAVLWVGVLGFLGLELGDWLTPLWPPRLGRGGLGRSGQGGARRSSTGALVDDVLVRPGGSADSKL